MSVNKRFGNAGKIFGQNMNIGVFSESNRRMTEQLCNDGNIDPGKQQFAAEVMAKTVRSKLFHFGFFRKQNTGLVQNSPVDW